MSDGDTFRLRPYDAGGLPAYCAVYATEQPPVDAHYRLPPNSNAALADYVQALRTAPVNQAAAALARTDAPAHSISIGRGRPRQASSNNGSLQPPPPSTTAVGVLEREPADDDHTGLPDPVDTAVAADVNPAQIVDEQVAVSLPLEGEHYHRNKKGQRVFEYYSSIGSDYVAVDADNNDLTDDNGNLIYVTTKGVAVEDRTGVGDWIRKGRNLLKTSGASTEQLPDDTPELFDSNGVPVEHFPVPAIGKSPIITARVWGGRRLAFLVGIALFVAAFAGSCGVYMGRSAVPAAGVISADERSTYRLTDLPAAAMSAFGQQYLQTCLTHGDADQVKARAAALAAVTTGGVSGQCGWQSGGKVQAPQLIQWTGRFTPIEGFGGGRAAYFLYTVSMQPGRFDTWSVPIWVNSAAESNDMSVVGDLGVTPGIRAKKPPQFTPDGHNDSMLASELQSSVLEPFFTAWAASNDQQIALAAASDAKPDVRTGLNGAFSNPQITAVQAYTTYTANNGQRIVYSNGDSVTAMVNVTWQVKASDSTQMSGYRVALRYADGKWQVYDIGGGALNDRAADPNSASGDGSSDSIDAGISDGATGGPATTTAAPESTTAQQPAPSTADPAESSESTPP